MRTAKKTAEKTPTHLTEDEFLRRHQYCVSIARLTGDRNKEETAARLAAKGQLKAVCDHPEDGWCGWDISPEKLREVNDRLAGRETARTPATTAKAFLAISEELEGRIVNDGFEVYDDGFKKRVQGTGYYVGEKRKRGRPRKTDKEPASYFCLKCSERHPLTKTDHLKFKRGRGRPRKV